MQMMKNKYLIGCESSSRIKYSSLEKEVQEFTYTAGGPEAKEIKDFHLILTCPGICKIACRKHYTAF